MPRFRDNPADILAAEAGSGLTITFTNLDGGKGADKFTEAIMLLPGRARVAARVFAFSAINAWRREMEAVAPKDTGYLSENIQVSAEGGPYSYTATVDDTVPYAVWVARGTLSSKRNGELFLARDYFHGAFMSSGPSRHNLPYPIAAFKWRGQKANPFDTKGYGQAEAMGAFRVAAYEAAEVLLGNGGGLSQPGADLTPYLGLAQTIVQNKRKGYNAHFAAINNRKKRKP
jgi:hypothetical protein